jgi:hypothetical protein
MQQTVDVIGPGHSHREQRQLIRAAGLVVLFATTIGILHATRLGLPRSLGGAQVEISEAFIRALGIWWLWALLAPLVFFVARRWHPERVRASRWLVAHAGGAVVVSMMHSLIYVPVMLAIVWPEMFPELASVWRKNLVGNVFGDVVTYVALAAVWYAIDFRRARLPIEPGATAATPDSELVPATTASRWRQWFPVREGGRTTIVPTSDVEWIEASGDYVVLHTRDRQYLATERIAHLATTLDPSQFVRVHRSAIVRIDCVRELHPRTHGDHDVVLANGRRVRLSRTYREALASALGLDL